MPAEPAPIIVSALFAGADFAWLDGLRRAHFPPERNLLPAHLTLFHHLPPSIVHELKGRLADLTRRPPPPARTDGLQSLGRGVAIRIAAAALAEIREALADAFAALLVPQDQTHWRPHVTVQNKVAPEQARALLATLGRDWRDRPLALAGIAAFYYRGGPWEPISRHMFRS